jgi:hypothetical protein
VLGGKELGILLQLLVVRLLKVVRLGAGTVNILLDHVKLLDYHLNLFAFVVVHGIRYSLAL